MHTRTLDTVDADVVEPGDRIMEMYGEERVVADVLHAGSLVRIDWRDGRREVKLANGDTATLAPFSLYANDETLVLVTIEDCPHPEHALETVRYGRGFTGTVCSLCQHELNSVELARSLEANR